MLAGPASIIGELPSSIEAEDGWLFALDAKGLAGRTIPPPLPPRYEPFGGRPSCPIPGPVDREVNGLGRFPKVEDCCCCDCWDCCPPTNGRGRFCWPPWKGRGVLKPDCWA